MVEANESGGCFRYFTYIEEWGFETAGIWLDELDEEVIYCNV